MSMEWERRPVRGRGLDLAAWSGPDNGPALLFVHGYPDTHAVWDRLATLLSPRFRCLAYDVRGAAESGVPRDRDGYRLDRLRADLAAVMDELAPGEPVHLIGHDWGSVQCWDAVIRADDEPRLTGRIASFTTISGPCLHHIADFRRSAREGGWRRRRQVLSQFRHSWYVFAFQVPWLPEWGLRRISRRVMATRDRTATHVADTLPDDSVHGLELYRANIFHREPLPGDASTDLPVLLVVPLGDKYVRPQLTDNVDRFASDLTRYELDAGHWAPWSHPAELAAAIQSFVTTPPADPAQPR